MNQERNYPQLETKNMPNYLTCFGLDGLDWHTTLIVCMTLLAILTICMLFSKTVLFKIIYFIKFNLIMNDFKTTLPSSFLQFKFRLVSKCPTHSILSAIIITVRGWTATMNPKRWTTTMDHEGLWRTSIKLPSAGFSVSIQNTCTNIRSSFEYGQSFKWVSYGVHKYWIWN